MTEQEGQKLKLSSIQIAKLTVAASSLFALWFFLLQQTFLAVSQRSYIYWIAPSVLLALLMPLVALSAIIFGHRLFFVTSLALAFGYLTFFPVNFYALLAIAFLFFGFWRAYYRTQFELHNNVKFSAHHITRRVIRIVLLVFLLVVSFNVYANVATEVASDPQAFYAKFSLLVTKGVLPVIERQLSGFDSELTLDQFIISGFTKSSPEFQSLPSGTRAEQVSQSRQRILAALGISATGGEPLSDVAQKAIEAKIKELLGPFSQFLPAIYGLAIFSLLRILGIFVGLASQVWGGFLFWILRKAEFLKITTTQILAEHVEI